MASKPKIYSTERWDARRPVNLTRQSPKESSRLFVHHSDFLGAKIDTFAEQAAAMRSMQNYHMDVKGWSTIGYNFVIFQPYGKLEQARLFEGRGLNAVPAAQEGFNTGNLALCLVGDFDKEKVLADTKDLMVRFSLWAPGNKLSGHQAVNSTDCPGKHIMQVLPEVAKKSKRAFVK